MISYSITTLTDIQWQAYFAWFRRITTRYMPREWVGSWEQFRIRKLANLQIAQTQEYVWFEEERPIAWIRMEVQSGKASFDWNADPTFAQLPLPLTQQISQVLALYLDHHNLEEIHVETGSPFMPAFAKKTQAQLINRRYFYELRKSTLQYSDIQQQLLTLEQKNPTLSFSLHPNRPDDILDAYIELYNVVAADIPRSNPSDPPQQSWPAEALRQLNETNRLACNLVYTGVLQTSSGQMIGLTDLNIHQAHPIRLYQGMTGVHPGYRGKGLGSWLKLAMLKQVWEDFPSFEIIDTDCNARNLPVQRMNEGLGFVRTGEGWEYVVRREKLEWG